MQASPNRDPVFLAWLCRNWARVISGLALAAVAAVTGRISYIHIYDLTLTLHQPEIVARLMPFGVDGLIVVGSVVLLQPPPGQRWLGWLGVGPGAAISLFANVESGIAFGWLAAGWAGIPAVAFTLSTFMLERWLTAQASAAPARSDSVGVPSDVVTAAEASMRATLAAGNPLSLNQLAERFSLTRTQATKVRDEVLALNGSGPHE